MTLQVANNAFGELNADINNSVTTIVLKSGNGARFPSLAGSQYFYATLIDTNNNLEIVKATARSSDTLTVVRAQDGTSARSFVANDRIELRPVAAFFDTYQQKESSVDMNGTELILDADGDTSITADTDDSIDFKTAGADRVNIDSAGHVKVKTGSLTIDTVGQALGIGTNNPLHAIHIKDTTPEIKVEETSSGGSKMIVIGVEADGTPYIDTPQSGGNIEFKCVGIPAMQITQTGDTNNPAEFRIKGGSGSLHQCITGTNWGYSTGYEAFMLGRDDNASEGTFSFGYNPRINSNGGFTGDGREVIFRRGMIFRTPNAANNGWYTQFTMTDGVSSGDFNDTSDEKLKQNIKDVSEGISIIKELRPVIFDWKDEGKGNGLGGFIAQEVQKILPNDVMGEEYVAPDREKDIEGTDGLSINTTSIVAHLTKALQEAITKIETLEAKVKALEET